MALEEPDMNSPQCNWGYEYTNMSPALKELNMFTGRIFHRVSYQLPGGAADIRRQRTLFCGVLVCNNMSPFQGSKLWIDMLPPASPIAVIYSDDIPTKS